MPCANKHPDNHWDQLHRNPRFLPRYPNDHVVRFLMANRALIGVPGSRRFLDIGVGGGRHLLLAAELGFEPYGIDTSFVGLENTRDRLSASDLQSRLVQASMLDLPFSECSFALALSFGVFYYGNSEQMKKAIAEAYRVLIPNGKLFAVLRTTEDCRFGKGEQVGPGTFRLKITETNEYDTVQHFLRADDINSYFASFSQISFEKTETTSASRTRVDSDWLVVAEK